MLKEELPIGFAMSLAMDTKALETYAHLSKRKKKALIRESQEKKSKEEMDRFVNQIREKYSD